MFSVRKEMWVNVQVAISFYVFSVISCFLIGLKLGKPFKCQGTKKDGELYNWLILLSQKTLNLTIESFWINIETTINWFAKPHCGECTDVTDAIFFPCDESIF
jgi:hypothetical protein